MRKLCQHSEADIVLLLKQGDKSAFEELYYRYIDKVLGFAGSFLLNSQEAEEIVQIVFINVWENRKFLNSMKNFRMKASVAYFNYWSNGTVYLSSRIKN